MERLLSILFGMAVLIVAVSCDDSTTSSLPVDDSFLFKVEVTDSSGDRLSGVRISAYNKLSEWPLATDGDQSSTAMNAVQFATTITLLQPVACHVDIAVFDLHGGLIDTLLDADVEAGETTTDWSDLPDMIQPGAYRCIATAYDLQTSTPLYRDSILMVLWQPVPDFSVLGHTDSRGLFETQDSLLFPNTMTLPPIPVTTMADPTVIDSFSILDTVRIVLTDTTTSVMRSFVRTVTNGRNVFELNWDEGDAMPLPVQSDYVFEYPTRPSNEQQVPPPEEFELLQNYPNPFN